MFDRTADAGRISGGKYTFLMRLALDSRVLTADETDVASQFHGRMRRCITRIRRTVVTHRDVAAADGTDGGNPVGFLFTAEDKKIYIACDTGLFGDMKLIGDEDLDLAVLPIGDNFTMGIDDAVRASAFLKAKLCIPMHYNTFDVIEADPNEFVRRVEAAGRNGWIDRDRVALESLAAIRRAGADRIAQGFKFHARFSVHAHFPQFGAADKARVLCYRTRTGEISISRQVERDAQPCFGGSCRGPGISCSRPARAPSTLPLGSRCRWSR